MFYLNAVTVKSYFKSLTGVTRMVLEDQSYRMKMAVLPSIDRIGDFPVKSTKIVPLFGFNVMW